MTALIAWSDTATGIGATALVLVVALVLGRTFSGKLGNIEVKLGSIDKSVNHRASDQPTMSQEVSTIHEKLDAAVTGEDSRLAKVEAAVTALALRVGALEGGG